LVTCIPICYDIIKYGNNSLATDEDRLNLFKVFYAWYCKYCHILLWNMNEIL